MGSSVWSFLGCVKMRVIMSAVASGCATCRCEEKYELAGIAQHHISEMENGNLLTKDNSLPSPRTCSKSLKLDKLSHQDLGQMRMYVNYFDRFVKTLDENPTIGILLCKKKKEAIVELTLPKDANIHDREYHLYLPSKEVLRHKLIDWVRERETGA